MKIIIFKHKKMKRLTTILLIAFFATTAYSQVVDVGVVGVNRDGDKLEAGFIKINEAFQDHSDSIETLYGRFSLYAPLASPVFTGYPKWYSGGVTDTMATRRYARTYGGEGGGGETYVAGTNIDISGLNVISLEDTVTSFFAINPLFSGLAKIDTDTVATLDDVRTIAGAINPADTVITTGFLETQYRVDTTRTNLYTAVNAKAPKSSPSFTGTVSAINLSVTNVPIITNGVATDDTLATKDYARMVATTGGSENLTLYNTTGSSRGVITKEGTRFLHNFRTYSIYLGMNAGNFTTTGQYNIGIGTSTLSLNTSGNYNVIIGEEGMNGSTTASNNTGVGYSALYALSTGGHNTAIGRGALNGISTGSNNVAIGSNAGYDQPFGYIASNTNSVFIGANASSNANGAINEIVIGYDAEGAGDNTTVIGNSSTLITYPKGTLNIDDGIKWSGAATGSDQWLGIDSDGDFFADSLSTASEVLKTNLPGLGKLLKDKQDGEIKWPYLVDGDVEWKYNIGSKPSDVIFNLQGMIEANLRYTNQNRIHNWVNTFIIILFMGFIAGFLLWMYRKVN